MKINFDSGLPAKDEPAVTQAVWVWFLGVATKIRNSQVPGWVWVVLLWALMAFPAAALRGAHYEEGTVIGLARGAVEEGHWLTPYLYGERFVERPVLLSWIAAALGSLTGGVGVWSARLPHLLFLLAGGLMVYDLVLSHTRKAPAVFGALCWFGCPMVAQKYVTAEPDVTMSVLMFAGFFLWWRGNVAGGVSLNRWTIIGSVLALAGLTKGPQPLGFFFLGVGAYLMVKRKWLDVPGFALANAIAGSAVFAWYLAVMEPGDIDRWVVHSRLAGHFTPRQWLADHTDFFWSIIAIEWLPASVLLIPAIIETRRNKLPVDRDLFLAVFLYAVLGTVALLFWPGGVASRYAMPANLGLAVAGGILFDRWWFKRSALIAIANTAAIGISTALVVLGWIIMPIDLAAFQQSKIQAQIIAGVRSMIPGPLYVTESMTNLNALTYAAGPIRRVSLSHIEKLSTASTGVLSAEELNALNADGSAVRAVAHARLTNPDAYVAEIRPR